MAMEYALDTITKDVWMTTRFNHHFPPAACPVYTAAAEFPKITVKDFLGLFCLWFLISLIMIAYVVMRMCTTKAVTGVKAEHASV